MTTSEIPGLAIAGTGLIVAALGLFARRGDFAEYRLKRDKNELLKRASDPAQQIESASTLVDIGFELQTKRERRAALALALEGRATVCGDSCWIAVDRMPVMFRQAMAARGMDRTDRRVRTMFHFSRRPPNSGTKGHNQPLSWLQLCG